MQPRLFRLTAAALAVAGLLTLSPRASADTISLNLIPGSTSVSYKPNGGSVVSVGGGPFHWTQTTPINTNYASAITTYCIDLNHGVTSGTYTTQSNLALAPTIGTAAKGSAITELFDRYYNSSLTSSANSSAFQLALWELVYDGATSKSLSAGSIQGDTTKAYTAQAQSMLTSLGSGSYAIHDLATSRLEALVSSNGNQDQIMVVPNPPKAIPAPPAVMLAGIGVLALFGRSRWTRRTPTAA